MEVLLLLVFVSLTLAVGAVLCFGYSVKQGDAEQAERLSLMPLEPNRTAEGRSSSGPLVRGLEPNRTAEGRSSSGPLARGLEPNRTAEGRSSSGPLARGLESEKSSLAPARPAQEKPG